MASEVEVPVCKTKEEGLKHGVTATGRMLAPIPANTHGLWRIAYVDGKSGSLPEKLSGRYTGQKFAKEDINDFVSKTWDLVAEQLAKAEVKAEAKAKKSKKEEVLTEVAA